jgi:glycosyltransferase involved in cell wall biosynthesis
MARHDLDSVMRIAMVSTPFVSVPPRTYGGTELVVHELVRGLTHAGHDVTLFATGDSEGPDVRAIFERPVWPPEEWAERMHAAAAAQEIRRGGFDLVHAHTAAFLEHAATVAAPTVYTIHHVREDSLLELYLRHPLVRYVAISRRQAELVPELDCDVVHHGLDPDGYPPGDGAGGYALFLGRLSHCKGPDLAVEAARRAGVELVVAGTYHEERQNPPGWGDEVRRLLDVPGVRPVGSVGGERKRRLLGGAGALVVPIRWEEPFGLVSIEAMLCGTPVIALARGAAPEIVDEGVTGFLVDDVAGMAQALGRVRSLDRDACRRRARERFSARQMIMGHLRAYHRALSERVGRDRLPVEEVHHAT